MKKTNKGIWFIENVKCILLMQLAMFALISLFIGLARG